MEAQNDLTQAAASPLPDSFLEALEGPAAPDSQTQPEEAAAEDEAAAETPDLPENGQAPAEEEALAAGPAALSPQRRADIQADLRSFAAAFPEVFVLAKDDPTVIPQSVWEAMEHQGLSLTAAYARYATGQARTAAGNSRNAARSTGSMRSAGNDGKLKDAFLSAFES